ncbi:MAG: hypothetical protein K0R84_1058 [Clostridia bacterium]|nr:hypothetical protein [Clostridia bacterium]
MSVEYSNTYPYMAKAKCKRRIIKVNGRGIVEAAPDLAVIHGGAVTEDVNAQNAQNQNDVIISNIISALLSMNIAREDIKTETYTILPIYDFEEGKQVLKGYRATHILEVKVYNLDDVGEILNTMTENGANQINNIEFTLKESARYYNRALRLAVADAEAKAKTIAGALGAALVLMPCNVVEQTTSFTPLAEQGAMKLAALDVVMPGRIEITAMIDAEFLYY